MLELPLFYRYDKWLSETLIMLSNKISFPVRRVLRFTPNVIWTKLRCWGKSCPCCSIYETPENLPHDHPAASLNKPLTPQEAQNRAHSFCWNRFLMLIDWLNTEAKSVRLYCSFYSLILCSVKIKEKLHCSLLSLQEYKTISKQDRSHHDADELNCTNIIIGRQFLELRKQLHQPQLWKL